MKKIATILIFAALTFSVLACGNINSSDKVVLGDERTEIYLPLLKGKRVAILSNQTGIVGDVVLDAEGKELERQQLTTEESSIQPFGIPEGAKYGPHVLDLLLSHQVQVTAIFSPEHGFRGTADAGEHVSSSVDAQTGVPILSLYEKGSSYPSAQSMSKFDVLVVDIQDVGLRYYTYYITMFRLMEACARYDKEVVVLDRPNPNGFYVDGPVLDMEKYVSGVGRLPVPIVHGMTLAELALMINGEGWLDDSKQCKLTVVPCKNYTHQTRYALLQRPSPNLKDMKSIYLYASTCFFEGAVATTGRGTEYPFEIYGHPNYDPTRTGHYTPGMESYTFTPVSMSGAKTPKFMNQICHGVNLRNKSNEKIWEDGVDLQYIIDAYDNLNIGDDFFLKNGFFELLTGVSWVRQMIETGHSADEIKSKWQQDVADFKVLREAYLLYAE